MGNFVFDRQDLQDEYDQNIHQKYVDNLYFKVFAKISVLKKVKIIVEKYLKNLYPFISLQSYDSNFKSQNVHFCKDNSQILLKKKSRILSKSKVSANLRY